MREQIQAAKSQGTKRTEFLVVDNLDGGWSTRSYPHRTKDGQMTVLDNFMHVRDNVWTLRPGNVLYGGGSGATGSGVNSVAGTRFYTGSPIAGTLLVHSDSKVYSGNDLTGAFTQISTGVMSTTQPASFAQLYDPDNASAAAVTCFIADGSRVPQRWDGANWGAVKTTAGFLPIGAASGVSITPKYVCEWNYHLVYANEPTDPTALWISDALRPERFTGTALTDSTGLTYYAYYPGGRGTKMGEITGIIPFGPTLIIFYTAGIVTCVNTGSYGSFQYTFTKISPTLGCPSPRSIVALDQCVIFFGGDRFYCTDGNYVVPLPDELPTLYGNDNAAQQPPEILDPTSVSAFRRGLSYLASYQSSAGLGYNDRIAVFDTQGTSGTANGWVWYMGTGGVWYRWPSGMTLNWGLECRGAGDAGTYPCYWGSSSADVIAEFDPPGASPAFTDFGNAISFELRTKAYFLERPVHSKVVEGLWPIMVFNAGPTQYTITAQPYAIFDPGQVYNFSAVNFVVPPQGTAYGSALYGSFLYSDTGLTSQQTLKSYPQGGPLYPKGYSVQLGISGSASNSFNLIGFVAELFVNEPEN